MPSETRAQALADFRAGRVQVLTNVGVLTEGFDDPGVSCIAMARPPAPRACTPSAWARGNPPSPRQDRLPDPGLRRPDDTRPVHPAVPVRHPTRPRPARRRRQRSPPRLAGPGVRSSRLRAGGRRRDPGRDPGPRRQLRFPSPCAPTKTSAPSPATPGSPWAGTAWGLHFQRGGRIGETLVLRRPGSRQGAGKSPWMGGRWSGSHT